MRICSELLSLVNHRSEISGSHCYGDLASAIRVDKDYQYKC